MTTAEKARFLQADFISLLRSIPTNTPPKWGKMNLQQMVEHFADAMQLASGRRAAPRVFTEEANLPKMQAFLMSDKPFRENTPNPLMPETPAPVLFASYEAAVKELETQVEHFFASFAANPKLTTLNPFFGVLDYDMNVQLLHKHALHHLRQFGVEVQQGSVGS